MSFRRLLPVLGVLVAVGLTSCNSDPQPEKKVIGVSVLTLTNPFFQVIADHIEETVAPHGYEVLVLSADEDASQQNDQVNDFISQGCVAIVLTPKNASAIATAIREANAAGIPVFTCDTGCTDDSVTVTGHVATDNEAGGHLAAQAMIEALGGHGKVAILHYFTTESCQARVKGFEDELNENESNIDIEIVATVEGEGNKEVSERVTRDLLQTHDDLVGLFCINDPSALGAVAALEQAEKLDDVTVIGFDGQRSGKQAILDGQILADPIQFPDRMGVMTGENIIAHFNGDAFESFTLMAPELYYKENAEQDPELQAGQ